jgi:hypothetical protein
MVTVVVVIESLNLGIRWFHVVSIADTDASTSLALMMMIPRNSSFFSFHSSRIRGQTSSVEGDTHSGLVLLVSHISVVLYDFQSLDGRPKANVLGQIEMGLVGLQIVQDGVMCDKKLGLHRRCCCCCHCLA